MSRRMGDLLSCSFDEVEVRSVAGFCDQATRFCNESAGDAAGWAGAAFAMEDPGEAGDGGGVAVPVFREGEVGFIEIAHCGTPR